MLYSNPNPEEIILYDDGSSYNLEVTVGSNASYNTQYKISEDNTLYTSSINVRFENGLDVFAGTPINSGTKLVLSCKDRNLSANKEITIPNVGKATLDGTLSQDQNGQWTLSENGKIYLYEFGVEKLFTATNSVNTTKTEEFAVENRKVDIDWTNENQYKYYLYYDYLEEEFFISANSWRGFGQIYFDTEEIAQQAIKIFKDELLWYFTEYRDSL